MPVCSYEKCRKDFFARHAGRKYCSPECAKAQQILNDRKKEAAQHHGPLKYDDKGRLVHRLICKNEFCGNEFEHYERHTLCHVCRYNKKKKKYLKVDQYVSRGTGPDWTLEYDPFKTVELQKTWQGRLPHPDLGF